MKIKSLLVIIFTALFFLPLVSLAQIPTPNPGNLFSNTDLSGIAVNIVNFIIGFIAILGIIFIIWGSIRYVTSAGDEGEAEDAKNTITYAALGLFIAALAYAIEDLVINKLFV